MCKVVLNEDLKGVEMYFDNKPNKEVLADIKATGFRWNGKKLCWYAKQSAETIAKAEEYKDNNTIVSKAKAIAKTIKNTIIDLFELTTYIKEEKEERYNTKEIAKEIRTTLKNRFKFVKFSITCPYHGKILVEIKASPFEKDSVYLKAIISYCEKVVDSYRYCISYDPYGDYGSSYNFYSNICIDYDYMQTELKDVDKIMALYDEKKKEADLIEYEKRQAEYKKMEEQREKEHQEYLKRKAEEEKEVKSINNHVKVVDLEDNEQYFVLGSQFANLNKNSTITEYQNEVVNNDFYLQDCKVQREIYFNDETIYHYFSNLLLNDFDFLSGTGGSYTDDKRVNTMEDYYNMTETEKQSVKFNSLVVGVYLNDKLMFVVDAQGYNYARYVGLIGDNTTITKEYTYMQEVSDQEIEILQVEAEKTINIINDTIEKKSIDLKNVESWKDNRKKLSYAIKANNIKLNKKIIQQVPQEQADIKNILYKCIKECDSITSQFISANIKTNTKLTIIKLSMIGGCSSSHITYKDFQILNNNVKIKCNIKGKRGLYEMTLNNDSILIYNEWLDINNLLWTATESGLITKYASYDSQCLEDIITHYEDKGIMPIINTYKPIF